MLLNTMLSKNLEFPLLKKSLPPRSKRTKRHVQSEGVQRPTDKQ